MDDVQKNFVEHTHRHPHRAAGATALARISRDSRTPPAGCRRVRYRATTARATSHQTAGRIVFPTQSFGDTLAVHGRMFRARRVEQIHADGLSGLRLPIVAALVFGKTYPLIGACSHVDDTEDRRPRLSSFGDDRKDDRNLIGSYFGRGNGKRSGEQIPGEFKTHPANTSQPFVRASVTPRSSYSPSEWSLRSRAASAFFTTFQ